MPDPLAVYVPVAALTKPVVRSILFAVLEHERRDWNHSRRTLLAFLLALNKKLEEIEASAETRHKIGDQIIRQVDDIRQWLVYEDDSGNRVEPNWDELRATYQKMIADKVDDTWTYYGGHRTKPYYELIISVSHPDIERSRVYMTRTRQNGFQSNELKLYWNAEQLEILCPKFGSQGDKVFQPPHDPSDADAVEGLCQYPVWQRNHSGKITYVTKGIEKTVFDVPKDAQIILLSFADEQSPGGGYLIRAFPHILNLSFGLMTVKNVHTIRIRPTTITNMTGPTTSTSRELQQQQNNRRRTEGQLIRMLLTQVLISIIFFGPYATFRLLIFFKLIQVTGIVSFGYRLSVSWMSLAYGTSLFAYILSGTIYRAELFTVFKKTLEYLKRMTP
ncbi:unnamed protein product [Rotaria sp. Silwood1]|nr:unnamed protein product [Rotaria sp. Silwood1]